MSNSIPLPNTQNIGKRERKLLFRDILLFREREEKSKEEINAVVSNAFRSNNSCQPFNSETSAILRDIIPIPYSENYFPKLASKLQTHHDRIILVPVS